MDDQQSYLLSGLLSRNFGVGRIVRFRHVQRGRQAESFELFTAQEKEYLVHLYPPAFAAAELEHAALAVNALDRNRFSVMPFLRSTGACFVAEGPQGRHMLLGLAPAGSAVAPDEYTEHDISQVGLRLAWMHRLLREQVAAPANPATVADLFQQRHLDPGILPAAAAPHAAKFPELVALARSAPAHGWTHGDITPTALLHDGDHQLRTVTDWALLHWGCPLQDLVDAFLFLSTSRDGMLNRRRGGTLLEAYDTLVPLKKIAWTPVIAGWCLQRVLSAPRRGLEAESFGDVIRAPERLATAMAACL